ncbi:unnamed protein product [Pieris macdunnoughi]|uniref:Uncharacterized protein n=1 Tax=Pieris macdunnoughi TaxID=345717 RepID=A0A821Y7P6_9NEOP|nr:unnamed protein product [Pieris macdunnoughi]
MLCYYFVLHSLHVGLFPAITLPVVRPCAFKIFKGKNKKSNNRVSPDPSISTTVEGKKESEEGDVDVNFCECRKSLTPVNLSEYSETTSEYHSSYGSYGSNHTSLRSYARSVSNSDSAYDSTRSSPAQTRPAYYATVTYLNVNDSEDSSSIHTEYTMLDYEDTEDEDAQNMINESIEHGAL